jgi:hypothetical protein
MAFTTDTPFNSPDTTDDQIPVEQLIPDNQNPNLLNDTPPE